MTSHRLAAACFAAATFLAATSAHALVVAGLYNTGVDDTGAALLHDEIADPHYRVVAADRGDIVGTQALTFTEPAWAPNDGDSRWVSNREAFDRNNLNTTYRLQFDLAGLDPMEIFISGLWGAEGMGQLYLNGVLQSAVTGGPGELHPFVLADDLQAGLNNLDFVIHQVDGPPTAFRVDDIAAYVDCDPGGVPEPAGWALMILGFGGVGVSIRRRRRALAVA